MRNAFIGLMLLVSTSALAQEAVPRFNDIPWGSGPATVRARMAELGAECQPKVDADGDFLCRVKMFDEPAGIIFQMERRTKLGRVMVGFEGIANGERAKFYETLVSALTEKYGPSTSTRGTRNYDIWSDMGLLAFFDHESVAVIYTAPTWEAEETRRSRKTAF